MSRPARLLLGATASALVLVALSAGGAAAGQANCQIEAHPPTLYAGMVFGAGRVVCSTPANKISITVALERDGGEVARHTRRDCQKPRSAGTPSAPSSRTSRGTKLGAAAPGAGPQGRSWARLARARKTCFSRPRSCPTTHVGVWRPGAEYLLLGGRFYLCGAPRGRRGLPAGVEPRAALPHEHRRK